MNIIANIYSKLFATKSHTHTKSEITDFPTTPAIVVGMPDYANGQSHTGDSWTSPGNGWMYVCANGSELWAEFKINNKLVGSIGTSHDNNSSIFVPVSQGDSVSVVATGGTITETKMTFFPFK